MYYPTLIEAVNIHKRTVEVSGGGSLQHLDLGLLESALQHIQNDDYYPTFTDKLTHLFHSACKFHTFGDGNKRIAIVLCSHMLLVNGYLYCASRFIREMENISYHVAANRIEKHLLREIIDDFINEGINAEIIKFKILAAIDDIDVADTTVALAAASTALS